MTQQTLSVQQLTQAIKQLEEVKSMLDSQEYGWIMTDSITEVIEALEFELHDQMVKDEGCDTEEHC